MSCEATTCPLSSHPGDYTDLRHTGDRAGPEDLIPHFSPLTPGPGSSMLMTELHQRSAGLKIGSFSNCSITVIVSGAAGRLAVVGGRREVR